MRGTLCPLATAMLLFTAGSGEADICDYKPSRLVGSAATSMGGAIAGGAAAAGIGMKAAGFYTLVHATSGLTMLGSTAAGASAAGTVGIIAGTGGLIGTAGSILMAPVTIVAGAITMVGLGAFEGVCYFEVERVVDPYFVREILESVAANDGAVDILRTADGYAMALKTESGVETYLLRDLYIADGVLKVRRWGPDGSIGPVIYRAPQESPDD